MPQSPKLLLIEDDPDAAELLLETIADHFGADCCTHVDHVQAALEQDLSQFDLALSDVNLPDGSGLELLPEMLAQREDLPVVMVTSESGLDIAMEAIRRGAYDYIVKAGDYLFTIPLIVEKNLEVWRTKQDNTRLQQELEQTLSEVRVKNEQLEEAVAKLESLASTDPLTGLANRRSIGQTLDRAFAEAQRHGTDLTCVMIDLDCFKPINDTLGHQMGDRLLKTAAQSLTVNCRRSDVAGRYGGDEFVLILPRTDPQTGMQVARRIQQEFRQATHQLLGDQAQTDMSLGLACVSISKPTNADQLVALADAALYRAKQAGRGRIDVSEPAPTHPSSTPAKVDDHQAQQR
jgi:diguanylate cyclase (GGDEF)-like protein